MEFNVQNEFSTIQSTAIESLLVSFLNKTKPGISPAELKTFKFKFSTSSTFMPYVVNGKLIGFISYWVSKKNTAHITGIYVGENNAKHTEKDALIKFIDWCKKSLNINKIVTGAKAADTVLVELYRSFGFKVYVHLYDAGHPYVMLFLDL